MNVDVIFQEFVAFTQELNDEEEQHIKESLSEEELALFDILARPDMQLTEKETKGIKQVCRELLNSLKADKLVLDWKKWQNTDVNVRVLILTGAPSGCALSVHGCCSPTMWWPQGWRYRWISPWNGRLVSSSATWNSA
jgi:hypothetical protein